MSSAEPTDDRASPLTRAGAWLLATALFLAALGLRFALVGLLPPQGFPFLTFFPAVMLAAYFCGLWPGLAVSAASILAARYFFIAPAHAFDGMARGDTVALVFFALVLLVDCVVVHVMATALDRLRRTTRALDDSRRALEHADRRKDAYLATLAHELRNPLAPIAVAAGLLGDGTPDAPVRRTAVDTIRRQVAMMSRLLDDLLDASRVTLDKLQVRREPVRVRALVDHALQAALPMLQARGHALERVDANPAVRVDVDPVRIEQVLVNLLNNAAKFTPEGGRVRIATEADPTHVRIHVSDSGVGLTGPQQVAVFELFAQVDQPAAGGGLGIGLHLARALARLHGGEVTVRSEGAGRGSTFTLALPRLADAPADLDARDTDRTPAPTAGRCLLLADDNRDNADMLALLCADAGYRVHTCYDGTSAWETAQAASPDVVLLDIGMPGLDGLEVARRIRATAWGAHARLVALSGWGRDEDRARTREAGFDAHLVKPVPPQDLLRVLER